MLRLNYLRAPGFEWKRARMIRLPTLGVSQGRTTRHTTWAMTLSTIPRSRPTWQSEPRHRMYGRR